MAYIIDWSKLRYYDKVDPGCWRVISDNNIEIEIASNENNLDPQRLEIAKQVWSNIQALEKRAGQYLSSFIAYDSTKGTWGLEGCEFGKRGDDPVNIFRLYMSLGLEDVYGMYHVEFVFDPDNPTKSLPYALGRIQM